MKVESSSLTSIHQFVALIFFFIVIHSKEMIYHVNADDDVCRCYLPNNKHSVNRRYSNTLICGSDLNVLSNNGTNSCDENKLYLCPMKPKNDEENDFLAAAPIADCPRRFKNSSQRCDDNPNTRNNCLRNMNCSCRGTRFRRNQVFCGKNLKGKDCNPNVLYRCRLLGVPDPVENCSYGCKNSKRCREKPEIIIKTNKTNDGEDFSLERNELSGSINSSTVNDDDNVDALERQEMEFVTFIPVLEHIPHFNP